MTPSQAVYVCQKYAAILDGLGATSVRNPDATTRDDRINHIRWMCDTIPTFCGSPTDPLSRDGIDMEKAMRWLGFVQGNLSAYDIRTIADMRQDNQ